MAILDGPTPTADNAIEALKVLGPKFDAWLNSDAVTPRMKSIIDLMSEGLSLAQILDVSKEHLDALFVEATRLIQSGQPAKARDMLTGLYQLDPLASRTLYALGLTYQLEGDHEKAGKIYIQFLALDATNVEGYLRLAECFLATGEPKNAVDTFGTAIALAKAGHGTAAQIEHANRMIDIAKSQSAPAKP